MFSLFKRKAAQAAVVSPDETKLLRSSLVPRIKHLAFEEALRERGIPAEQMPPTAPLVGELLVTYAFDLPEQFVMASASNLARAGISLDEVHALATRNLTARLPTIEYYEGPGVHLAVTGGDLEACLLLAEKVWDDAATRFKRGFVVCVPRRDRLLVSDGGDAEAIAAIRRAAEEFYTEQDDGHALSLQLMSRVGNGWRLHAQ